MTDQEIKDAIEITAQVLDPNRAALWGVEHKLLANYVKYLLDRTRVVQKEVEAAMDEFSNVVNPEPIE